jgi:hypothetical protein
MYRLVAFLNRRWIMDQWVWLQRIHCAIGHPGVPLGLCNLCVRVSCYWCQTASIRLAIARLPSSGWEYHPVLNRWSCPRCLIPINAALTQEPITPTI